MYQIMEVFNPVKGVSLHRDINQLAASSIITLGIMYLLH